MKHVSQWTRWSSVGLGLALAWCAVQSGVRAAPASAAQVGTQFCFGVGCPCGNDNINGNGGCANLYDPGAQLQASGSSSVAANDLTFDCSYGGDIALLFGNSYTSPMPKLMGDGVRCVGTPIRRLGVRVTGGIAHWGPGVSALGGWNAGETWYFQVAYRNTNGSPCPNNYNFNVTSGVAISFTP